MQHLNNPEAAGTAGAKLQEASIGIIGLGRMGQVFGELLLGSVARLMVYDRDSERVEAAWMPWNYRQTLEQTGTSKPTV